MPPDAVAPLHLLRKEPVEQQTLRMGHLHDLTRAREFGAMHEVVEVNRRWGQTLLGRRRSTPSRRARAVNDDR